MVIDAESFYGKRKNETSLIETSIIKYESLKKIKNCSGSNTNVKKKKFYKQREALLYYECLKKQLRGEGFSKNLLIYTEELDNSKRSFIVESVFSFLQFYCFYALRLDTIYFAENKDDEKTEEEEEKEEKQIKQATEYFKYLEGENIHCNTKEKVVENKGFLEKHVKKENVLVKTELKSQYSDKDEETKQKEKKEVQCKKEIKQMAENQRESLNLYELIVAEEKRWLYFDLEYECNIENKGKKEIILFIFLIELCLFVYKKFDIKLNLIDFLILDSSSKHKISFHVIIKNIHSVPCDYSQYLIDYCYFFLNETKLPENSFYKKYKQMAQMETEEVENKKKYLLFDNEEIIKHFVELFINKIIKKMNKTENVHVLKSQSICLDFYRNSSFDKKGFDFFEEESLIKTPMQTPMKSVDYKENAIHICDNYNDDSSSRRSSNTMINNNRWQCEVNGSTDRIEKNEIHITKDTYEKRNLGENIKNQYFEIYKHSLKDIVEYYINKFQRCSKNIKKYNYIILLYVIKKQDMGNEFSFKKKDEKGSYEKNAEEGKKEKKNIDVIKIEQEKEKGTEKGTGEEGNISDEELKKEIEWFIKNDNDFFETYDKENGNCINTEERFMLQCVIDNSVYSRNRNFRMVFSTKKNKENKLLLSPMNVKKYNKKKINDVILKSLITFYNYEDTKYQIKKEQIYKIKETERVHNFHVLKIPDHVARIYKKKVVKSDKRCKIINYDTLNDAHLNDILKIIFFWNFLLYKNFKKHKTYLVTFRGEIEKEYFYKIVAIYNNFNFKKYEDFINFFRKTLGSKEIDSPLKKNGRLNKNAKRHTDVISNYLDNFDNLFLHSMNFFEDMLKTYKKYFNLGDEEDHRIFFVRYFLYSLTLEDNEYTLFFRDNKYCRNKKFSHKSNHIYLIYNIRYGLFIQKCYDESCQHFVSDIFQL